MIGDILLYLAQSALTLAIFYSLFWLFLRKETYYGLNRFYLLAAAVLSVLIPAVKISMPVDFGNYMAMLDPVIISSTEANKAVLSNMGLFEWIWLIYIAGVALFLSRFLFQIVQIISLIAKYGISFYEGHKIVNVNKEIAPFSFFNLMFINTERVNDDEIKEIIAHEMVHIKQNHTLDTIWLELLLIAFWFNPFLWFYRKSLKGIHEFLADRGVLQQGYSKQEYQSLLLNMSLGSQINDLTNNFNHSLIKNRIIMMTKIKSNQNARWKFLLALPALFFVVLMFSTSFNNYLLGQTQSAQEERMIVKTTEGDIVFDSKQAVEPQKEDPPVYTVVEEMPEYPGGRKAMTQFIIDNLKYPEKAKNEGIQGTVFVTFVIDDKGNVGKVKILRGIGGGCDEEALRVVSEMPTWIPGKQEGKPVNVAFNLPIKFNLEGDKKEEKKE